MISHLVELRREVSKFQTMKVGKKMFKVFGSILIDE
jgi:hypothetical protein